MKYELTRFVVSDLSQTRSPRRRASASPCSITPSASAVLPDSERSARRAGELADTWALRGYNAIHLASAEAILDEGDVMVVSDLHLAEAAASIGLEAVVPAEE